MALSYKILVDAPGQMCNRFWAYLDLLAWAMLNNKKLIIWYWDPSINNFDALREHQNITFPFYVPKWINKFGNKRYHDFIARFLSNALIRPFYETKLASKLGFCISWHHHDKYQYYPLCKDKILQAFRPNLDITSIVDSVFNQKRVAEFFIIGVHIRLGDYRTWMNGKYFMKHERYRDIMQQVASLYKDKKVCFYIATNEPYDASMFSEFDILSVQNPRAAHDVYALSKCDRIFGPNSSFSRWASFYGGVPLCFVDREKGITKDEDFSVIADYYHFKNGNEIDF